MIMNVGHVLYLSSVMCEKSVAAQPKVNSEQVPSRAEARVGSCGLGGSIRTAFSSVSPDRVDRRKKLPASARADQARPPLTQRLLCLVRAGWLQGCTGPTSR